MRLGRQPQADETYIGHKLKFSSIFLKTKLKLPSSASILGASVLMWAQVSKPRPCTPRFRVALDFVWFRGLDDPAKSRDTCCA